MAPCLRGAVALALLGAVHPLSAQPGGGAPAAELRRCRAIVDGAARLACYDAIVLHGVSSAGAAASSSAPAAAATAPPPPASASAPLTASSVATAAAAQRNFGLPERPAVPPPEAIETTFTGEFEGWTPGARLRFANGQLWEIADGSTAAYRLRDPKVKITRGFFGSFFLQVEGVAQTPRVRRVQ